MTGQLVAGLLNFYTLGLGAFTEVEFLDSMAFVFEASSLSLVQGVRFIQKGVPNTLLPRTRIDLYLRIVNRLCFEVSEFVPVGERFFGGFAVPFDEERVALLWPLACSEGQIILVARSSAYTGEDYNAVGEFRHFEALYPRRKSLRCPS